MGRIDNSKMIAGHLGVALLLVGVVGEHLLGPGWVGWLFILTGLGLEVKLGRPQLWRTPADWPVALLLLLAALSLLVSADKELTIEQVSRLAASAVAFYGIAHWLAGNPRRPWFALLSLLAAALGLALAAPFIVEWHETKEVVIPSHVYDAFPLLVANAVHPNIMAAALVSLLPVPLFLLLSPPGGLTPKERVAGLSALIVIGGILILTRSRGGYMAGGVALIGVLLLTGRWRWLIPVAPILAALGYRFWIAMESAPVLLAGALDTATWAFRMHVWAVALQIMADFPFTGAGMGAFNQVASRLYPFAEQAHPGAHNLFLQVGVDLGLIGLIAYLSLLGATAAAGWRAYRYFQAQGEIRLAVAAAALLVGLTAYLVHGLVDNALWNTRAAFLPWLMIGCLLALRQIAAR